VYAAAGVGVEGVRVEGLMDRMGHSQIQTTQKYLHTMPDTDQRNLDALARVQNRRP
jgi:integrase